MEAAGLAGFVIVADLVNLFMEHPDLPPMQTFLGDEKWAMLRRVPTGLALLFYLVFISKLTAKRSGAHLTPPISWAYVRLGRMRAADAIGYTAAHFAGAFVGVGLLVLLFEHLLAHPVIHYGVSKPAPLHAWWEAFVGEVVIMLLLVTTEFLTNAVKRLEKIGPWIAGVWLALFVVFESPYSGMSLNPARSTAPAVFARDYDHLWIYFVAPFGAALLAAEIFLFALRLVVGLRRKSLPYFPRGEYPES